MSTRAAVRRLALLLIAFLVTTAGWAQDTQGEVVPLHFENFATEVAERLRDEAPQTIDKPIHWLFMIDTSGSMLGKSNAAEKMLRSFLEHTVVTGDRMSRVRYGAEIRRGPEGIDVGSGSTPIDAIVNGMEPEVGGAMTVASQARDICAGFVEETESGYVRVALLVSDSGASDGDARGDEGQTAAFTWSGKVVGDRDRAVDMVCLYWTGPFDEVERLPSHIVRKVPLKVEKEIAPRVPARDPDAAKRRAFSLVPWVLGFFTLLPLLFAFLQPRSAKLRVVGRSAELGLTFHGGEALVPVHSGGSSFYLNRTEGSNVIDGTALMDLSIERPFEVWREPVVRAEGRADPVSDDTFQIEIDGGTYDYRVKVTPGKHRISVRNSSGVVVRDEQIELIDTKLRYLLLWILAMVVVWLGYFIFGSTIQNSFQKPLPAQPAIVEMVPRDLQTRSNY